MDQKSISKNGKAGIGTLKASASFSIWLNENLCDLIEFIFCSLKINYYLHGDEDEIIPEY